ncbi:hypothetical protein PsorP6_013191 [Peronosclerospora sorghi]|uniref:Uncharacterized protein n=1 Tax=Peronosclerospora sorghi TaxID=230839 RepID=A0ACC0WGZ6_9STRA|nr:hypothetical protein PsorP6_013191 [Peronosclerospora sorghi]
MPGGNARPCAASDPVHAPPTAAQGVETATRAITARGDGKENHVPSSSRPWGHAKVTMRRGSYDSMHVVAAAPRRDASTLSSSVLGKRRRLRPDACTAGYNEPSRDDAAWTFAEDGQDVSAALVTPWHDAQARAVDRVGSPLSFDAEEEPTGLDCTTMVVDDVRRMGLVRFGTVAFGDRKSRRLILQNTSDARHARVKYDGYRILVHDGTYARMDAMKRHHPRIHCDLHVCVVEALKSVTLRVTFEPLPMDVGHRVTAMLKFTVNDQWTLQCRAIGDVMPPKPKLGGIGHVRTSTHAQSTVVASSGKTQQPRKSIASTDSTVVSSVLTVRELERDDEPRHAPSATVGTKRHLSAPIELSPPHHGVKRRKRDATHEGGVSRNNLRLSRENKLVPDSWWKKRQAEYDEQWMAKQMEGFTKWINYVLLEDTGFCVRDDDERVEPAEPRSGRKRRVDFSCLRVLAQKRMESRWIQAGMALYHSPSMQDVLFNLQDEIGNRRLLFRADRPVYADVGLQTELITLLNNYHPVWLCLGLAVVLGNQIMQQEKCSLRTICILSHGKATSVDSKMPSVLRRIILKHVVKDSHVAQNYGLVKNLMMPLDGSTVDRGDGGNAFINTKKNITGREYFDSLTQSLMLKFLMLVFFLDRAIEHRGDTFSSFPCLFRVVPASQRTSAVTVFQDTRNDQGKRDDDVVSVKQSQVVVTEFCRLFLASEGRIDKHLKTLDYTLKHKQTALDELDLEITNLETDLRDGVRLSKLMEKLTGPGTSLSPAGQDERRNPPRLSSLLRVPALSRLQKVHNVEICLHFFQQKCGANVLDRLKSNFRRTERVAGRVRVSTAGFAGLRASVDKKMVAQLAKEIVNGNREHTLALLWKVMSHFQLPSLVNVETMQREIATVVKRMSFRAKEFFDAQQATSPLGFTEEHECYGVLLEWCRAVCANYNVRVDDFSRSFADGKVLCYVLHYYHPMLLSKSDILPTTRDVASAAHAEEDMLLANEQRHFALVNTCVKQLGHVPVLLPQQYHTKNPPDAKMVLTFVCYLQSRLMDSCHEVHAACRLQRWWNSPWLRVRRHRQKTRSARILQRFWYTSSQQRLAIRQCRKLLRAAHVVKATVLTWCARRRFQRLRKAVRTIQAAFRARRTRRVDATVLDAIHVIQFHWRKQLEWRYERRERLERWSTIERENARRALSCRIIERNWLLHLSRAGARLVRQQLLDDRATAAACIQGAWRLKRVRVEVKQRRMEESRRKWAARAIQMAWRRLQDERTRILALKRLELEREETARNTRRRELQHRVEKRAATCIQQTFRAFALTKRTVAATKIVSVVRGTRQRRRFVKAQAAVHVLERTIRAWRRRRHVAALQAVYSMWTTYQQMQRHAADQLVRQLQAKGAARCIQRSYRRHRAAKRAVAATAIQRRVRVWRAQRSYRHVRRCVCLLQQNVRRWRRWQHFRALERFHDLWVRYRRIKQEEIRLERLGRLHARVASRAALCIQSRYRVYVHHKRVHAALCLQALVRGWQAKQRVARRRRAFQRQWAAREIQKWVRGWTCRRTRLDFYAVQAHLRRLRLLVSCWQIELWYVKWKLRYRKKRLVLIRARWTQLGARILHKRRTDVDRIATCWRAWWLRTCLDVRIQEKRRQQETAQRIQVWWLQLCCHWSERAREDERQRRHKMEAIAVARAKRLVASWIFHTIIVPSRHHRAYIGAVTKLQAWCRGLLVRLHCCNAALTRHRKRIGRMKLVDDRRGPSSVHLEQLRVKTGTDPHEQERPQTLGARLEMALHLLLHGKRLQDMLFASHTIEVCTRYSHECCRTCVQLQISATIFAAIRGLNRSRPHVELLHQLLLVLKNLTGYRRSADKQRRTRIDEMDEDVEGRLEVDLRALDTLVDLLHIHRDMHHVFVLSAEVIAYYLTSLQPLRRDHASVHETWSEAAKRLTGLQELSIRKLALYNATATFRRTKQGPETSGTNLMRKMNPKTAVAIMEQVVALLQR